MASYHKGHDADGNLPAHQVTIAPTLLSRTSPFLHRGDITHPQGGATQLANAVGDLNFVLMRLSGTTLEEVAERGEKRMEEERAPGNRPRQSNGMDIWTSVLSK